MKEEKFPTTREILLLLGVGTLITASIIMPGLGVAAGAILKAKRRHDWEENQKAWKKFNLRLLKRNLKRLQVQKVVEIKEGINGQQVLKLTSKGRTKFLKFRLEELSLKKHSWDGRWRLIIYDVGKLKRNQQENFRRFLKKMNFLQLQKSVYMTPFKCQDEIVYLREYFDLGEEVLLLEVSKLENEEYYKPYFGLG